MNRGVARFNLHFEVLFRSLWETNHRGEGGRKLTHWEDQDLVLGATVSKEKQIHFEGGVNNGLGVAVRRREESKTA